MTPYEIIKEEVLFWGHITFIFDKGNVGPYDYRRLCLRFYTSQIQQIQIVEIGLWKNCSCGSGCDRPVFLGSPVQLIRNFTTFSFHWTGRKECLLEKVSDLFPFRDKLVPIKSIVVVANNT